MPKTASQQDVQAGEIGAAQSVTKISGGDQRIACKHADAKAKDEIILGRLACTIFRCSGFDFRDFETQVSVATVSKAFRSAAGHLCRHAFDPVKSVNRDRLDAEGTSHTDWPFRSWCLVLDE